MTIFRDRALIGILEAAQADLATAIRDAEAIPPDVVTLGVINRLEDQRQILSELAAEIESDRRARLEDERDAAADARCDEMRDEMRDDRLVP